MQYRWCWWKKWVKKGFCLKYNCIPAVTTYCFVSLRKHHNNTTINVLVYIVHSGHHHHFDEQQTTSSFIIDICYHVLVHWFTCSRKVLNYLAFQFFDWVYLKLIPETRRVNYISTVLLKVTTKTVPVQ